MAEQDDYSRDRDELAAIISGARTEPAPPSSDQSDNLFSPTFDAMVKDGSLEDQRSSARLERLAEESANRRAAGGLGVFGQFFPSSVEETQQRLSDKSGEIASESAMRAADTTIADIGQRVTSRFAGSQAWQELTSYANRLETQDKSADVKDFDKGAAEVERLKKIPGLQLPNRVMGHIEDAASTILGDFAGAAIESIGIGAGYAGRAAGMDVTQDQNSIAALGRWSKAVAREYFPGDASRQDEFATQLVKGVASTAGFWGVNAAAYAARLSKPWQVFATAAVGGLVTSSGTYNEAVDSQKAGRDVSETQKLFAYLGGHVIGWSEVFPIAGNIPGLSVRTKSEILAHMASVAREGTEEAMQEAFQGFSQNLLAQTLHDPDRSLFDGVSEGALIGFLSGGLIQGARLGMSRTARQQSLAEARGASSDAPMRPATSAPSEPPRDPKTATFELSPQPVAFNPAQELAGSARFPGDTGAAGGGSGAAPVQAPSFSDVIAEPSFPFRDASGSADLAGFHDFTEQVTGKRFWSQLTDPEKIAVDQALIAYGRDGTAPVSPVPQAQGSSSSAASQPAASALPRAQAASARAAEGPAQVAGQKKGRIADQLLTSDPRIEQMRKDVSAADDAEVLARARDTAEPVDAENNRYTLASVAEFDRAIRALEREIADETAVMNEAKAKMDGAKAAKDRRAATSAFTTARRAVDDLEFERDQIQTQRNAAAEIEANQGDLFAQAQEAAQTLHDSATPASEWPSEALVAGEQAGLIRVDNQGAPRRAIPDEPAPAPDPALALAELHELAKDAGGPLVSGRLGRQVANGDPVAIRRLVDGISALSDQQITDAYSPVARLARAANRAQMIAMAARGAIAREVRQQDDAELSNAARDLIDQTVEDSLAGRPIESTMQALALDTAVNAIADEVGKITKHLDPGTSVADVVAEMAAPSFDPFAFSAPAVLKREGEDRLRERLAGLAPEQIKAIASGQNIGGVAGDDLPTLVDSFVAGTRARLAGRYAAASGSDGYMDSMDRGTRKSASPIADIVAEVETVVEQAIERLEIKSQVHAPEKTVDEIVAEAAKIPAPEVSAEQKIIAALEQGKDKARRDVVAKGKRYGREYGAMVLADGAMKINRVPSETRTDRFLLVNKETAPELWNQPPRTVDFHHNHPKSTSFSRADYTEASVRPSLRKTWVHGHDGSEYWAEFVVTDPAVLGQAYDAAKEATYAADAANLPRYRTHLIAGMLAEAGLIRYRALLAPETASTDVEALQSSMGQAWPDAVTQIKEIARDVLDRGTGPAGQSAGLAGAPSGTGEAGAGTGSATGDGDGADGARREARPGDAAGADAFVRSVAGLTEASSADEIIAAVANLDPVDLTVLPKEQMRAVYAAMERVSGLVDVDSDGNVDGRWAGDPKADELADVIGFMRDIDDTLFPFLRDELMARVDEDVAAYEAELVAADDAAQDSVLDAPNFGMPEPPRTLPDGHPLLVSHDTDFSPERVAMRERLIEQRFAGKSPVREGETPVAYLMGGGGASGKGTLLKRMREQGFISADFVEIDPDTFKTGLAKFGWDGIPEYWLIDKVGDTRGASVTHEESSLTYKAAQKRGMDGRYNMVLDQTLGTPDKGVKLIESLKAAGYEVRLVGVTVDPELAIKRAVERAKGPERRYVALDTLLAAHKGFSQGFETYADLATTAKLFDTNVPLGVEERKIAEKLPGAALQTIDPDAYIQFVRKGDLDEKADTIRQLRRSLDGGSQLGRSAGQDAARVDAGRADRGDRGAQARAGGERDSDAGQVRQGLTETNEEGPVTPALGVSGGPLALRSVAQIVDARIATTDKPVSASARKVAVALERIGSDAGMFHDLVKKYIKAKTAKLADLNAIAYIYAGKATVARAKKDAIHAIEAEFIRRAEAEDDAAVLAGDVSIVTRDAEQRAGGRRAAVRNNRLRESQRALSDGGVPEGLRQDGEGRDAGSAPAGDGRGSRRDVPGDGGRGTAQPDADQLSGAGAGARSSAAGGQRGGDGRDYSSPAAVEASAAADRARADRRRANYRITEADQIGVGGPKAKVRANLEAIRIIRKLEEENRSATPEEQKAIVKYVGWGAFAQEMFQEHKAEWAKERQQLRDLISADEYAAATKSVLNAHYTSKDVIDGMWSALEHLGFSGGTAIEPAAGVGHFIGLMPEKLTSSTDWTAVELDKLTGAIAKNLYQGSDVRVQGYETANFPDNFFDLAISNVPFGDFTIEDRERKGFLIHDYFFVKSLAKVRPGGLVAFITSAGTMDKASSRARHAMARHADLVGAIRLPGGNKGAFASNAGTEVTTDILFLRKRVAGEPVGSTKWLDTVEIETPEGPTRVNEYFAANPDMMLGKMRLAGTMYREKSPVLIGPTDNLGARIMKAAEAMPANVFAARATVTEDIGTAADLSAEGTKEGALFLKGGKLYQNVMGAAVPQKAAGKTLKRMRGLIALRDLTNDILASQMKGDRDALPNLRAKLTTAYDAFVNDFGPINKTVVTSQMRKQKDGTEKEVISRRYPNLAVFDGDPDYFKVAALDIYNEEKGTAVKTALFTEDVIAPYQRPDVTGPADALAVSLNETGRISIPRIAEMLKVSEPEAIAALGDRAYLNPNGEAWETSEIYLSGDVVAKLDDAKAAAETDSQYQRNVAALENVQPVPLTRVDIRVSLGSPWIPTEVYNEFIAKVIGLRGATIKREPVTSTWIWETKGAHSYAAQDAFGTPRASVQDILIAAFNSKSIKVFDKVKDGDGEAQVLNVQATEDVAARIKLVQETFAGDPNSGLMGWAFEDDERATTLEALYNRTFNRLVTTKYDGSHLDLPGLAKTLTLPSGKVVPLDRSPHRVNAIWRAVVSGNMLMDHAVGSGKTITAIAAAMEMKRLGQIQRPMFVVPNHMLEQFGREFLQAYPNAKILVADKKNMEAKNRKAFAARIAADKWDGIIITHSAFGRLPMQDQAYAEFIEAEIREVLDAWIAAKKAAGERADVSEFEQLGTEGATKKKGGRRGDATVKQIESKKISLQNQLNKLLAKDKKDDGVLFEELGVDFVVYDESHAAKNLTYNTQHTNVKGLGVKGSQRAMDLFIKIRHLEKARPGRSSIFMTGTPMSRSMAEIYTIQRYLQLDMLKEYGIEKFDAWAATFGRIVTNTEQGINMKLKDVASFSKFINVPELVAIYSRVADSMTAEQLNLPRPALKGGMPLVVISQMGAEEKAETDRLIQEMEQLKGPAEKGQDNHLSLFTKTLQVATDMRLLYPDAPFNPNGKVAKVVDKVTEIYKAGTAPALGQLIFLDMGVPGTKAKVKEKQPFLSNIAKPASLEEWEDAMRGGGDNGRLTDIGATESQIDLVRKKLADPDEDTDETEADAEQAEVEALLAGKFNLYDDIKKRLVANGIPEKEIAFIHDAKTDTAKAQMFKAMREGKIRVMLGSSGKMGVGTNVQRYLVAMHHVDAPWNPADVVQRDGRILRQGNENKEVSIFRYVTELSADAYRWQILARKAEFEAQFRAGARGLREAEDIDSPIPEASMLKALATGDSRIMEHAELTKEVRELDAAKRGHERTYLSAQRSIVDLKKRVATDAAELAKIDQDVALVTDLSGDNFHVRLDTPTLAGEVKNRKKAGEAIRDHILSSLRFHWGRDSIAVNVGAMSGLKMIADGSKTDQGLVVQVRLEGVRDYISTAGKKLISAETDPVGLMRAFENVLTGIKGFRAYIANRVAADTEQLAKLESKAVASPFPKALRLAEAKARLEQLSKELKGAKEPAQVEDGETELAAFVGDAPAQAASGILSSITSYLRNRSALTGMNDDGTPFVGEKEKKYQEDMRRHKLQQALLREIGNVGGEGRATGAGVGTDRSSGSAAAGLAGTQATGDGSQGRDAVGQVLADPVRRADAIDAFLSDELRRAAVEARAESQGFTTIGYHGSASGPLGDLDPFRRGAPFGIHVGMSNPAAANARVGYPTALQDKIYDVMSRVLGGGLHKPAQDAALYPMRLRVSNPLRMPHLTIFGHWHLPGAWLAATKHPDYEGPESLTRFVAKWVADRGPTVQGHEFSRAISQEMERLGYDAIVYRDTSQGVGLDSLFVWDASRVRSSMDFFHPDAAGATGLRASDAYVEQDLNRRLTNLLVEEGLEEAESTTFDELAALVRAYHGTDRDLPLDAGGRIVIDPRRFGARTGVPTEALFLTDNVALASAYGDPLHGGDRVYRQVVDTANMAAVDMKGYRWSDDDGRKMTEAIAREKSAGRDGIVFSNMSDGAIRGQRATQYAIWNQTALRSPDDIGAASAYQRGQETGNAYLDAALENVGFDLANAVAEVERLRGLERGGQRKLEPQREAAYASAIERARELGAVTMAKPSTMKTLWRMVAGGEDEMSAFVEADTSTGRSMREDFDIGQLEKTLGEYRDQYAQLDAEHRRIEGTPEIGTESSEVEAEQLIGLQRKMLLLRKRADRLLRQTSDQQFDGLANSGLTPEMWDGAGPLFAYAGSKPTAPAQRLTPQAKASESSLRQDLASRLEQMLPKGVAVSFSYRLFDSMGREQYGRFRPEQRLVELALAHGGEKAFAIGAHEIVHVLREAKAFTDAEWKALADRARKVVDLGANLTATYRAVYAAQARKAGMPTDLAKAFVDRRIEEEQVAKLAEMHFSGGSRFGATVDAILAKMRDILDAIVAAFNGQGMTSPDMVFRRMERGALAKRVDPVQPSVVSTVYRSSEDLDDAEAVGMLWGQPTQEARQRPFRVSGYDGSVSIQDRSDGLQSRVYAISKDGGEPLVRLAIAEREPGLWDIIGVRIARSSQGKGLSTKVMAAIEDDLGRELSTGGIVSDAMMAKVQASNPERVRFHVQGGRDVDGLYLSPASIEVMREASGKAKADEIAAKDHATMKGLETRIPDGHYQVARMMSGWAAMRPATANPQIEQVWGPKFDILMGQQYRIAEAGGDLSTMYDILSGKLAKASGITPEMRAAMEAKRRELYTEMGPDGRKRAGIADDPAMFAMRPVLDLSPEARKARAEEMGFDTKIYHMTDAQDDFAAFDVSKSGQNNEFEKGALFFSESPAQTMIARQTVNGLDRDGNRRGSERIMPLMTRSRDLLHVNLWDVYTGSSPASSGFRDVMTKMEGTRGLGPDGAGRRIDDFIAQTVKKAKEDWANRYNHKLLIEVEDERGGFGRYELSDDDYARATALSDAAASTIEGKTGAEIMAQYGVPVSVGFYGGHLATGPAIELSRRAGKKGVRLSGMHDGSRGEESPQIMITDPSIVRSVNAVFDPMESESAQLLASFVDTEDSDPQAPRTNKDGMILALPFREKWGDPRFNPEDRARALARLDEIRTIPVRSAKWADLVEARDDIDQIFANFYYYNPATPEDVIRDNTKEFGELAWSRYLRSAKKDEASASLMAMPEGQVPADIVEFRKAADLAVEHMLSTDRRNMTELVRYGERDEPTQRRRVKPENITKPTKSGFYFAAARKLAEVPDNHFKMGGIHVLNYLMQAGVKRAELEHFKLFDLGLNTPVSRETFETQIAKRMWDFRSKTSWLNPEVSKTDYEMGGTRAFRGPRIPGRGIYFERLLAFPKTLKGGETFPPGYFDAPHWEGELKGTWASIRGSIREVPGWGKVVIGEEQQSDFMQGMNTGRRPKMTTQEFIEEKKKGKILPAYGRTPESPIEDNYVRTMVRDLLMLAASKNADTIAISTSETSDRIQANTYSSAGHFYDGALRNSLEKELRRITGDGSITLEKIALPKAMGQARNQKAYTVWAAKISKATVAKINTEKLPMFAYAPQPGHLPNLGNVNRSEITSPGAGLSDLVTMVTETLGIIPPRMGRIDPGLKARMARVGARVYGHFSRRTGITRMAIPNDLPTLLHEGGHSLEIHKQLGPYVEAIKQAAAAELVPLASPGPDQLSEGWAEFFRLWMVDPRRMVFDAPVADQQFRRMLETHDPALLQGLEAIQTGWAALQEASPAAVLLSRTKSAKEVEPTLAKEVRDRGMRAVISDKFYAFTRDLVDSKHPLKVAVRFLVDEATANLGGTLAAGERVFLKALHDPYKLARLSEHARVHATAILQRGVRRKGRDLPSGPSMQDVLAEAFGGTDKASWNDERYQQFGAFLVARRMMSEWDRFEWGLLDNPPDPLMGREAWAKALTDLETAHPEFKRAGRRLDAFMANMLEWKRENGFLSSEQYEDLRMRDGYAPLNRVMDQSGPSSLKSKGTNKRKLIFRFRGSSRDFINPVDSIISDVYQTQARVELNAVIRALDQAARAAGPNGGRIAERIPAHEMKGQKQDTLAERLRAETQAIVEKAVQSGALAQWDAHQMMDDVDTLFDQQAAAVLFKATETTEKGEKIVWLWEDGKRIPIRVGDDQLGSDIFDLFSGLGKLTDMGPAFEGVVLFTQAFRAGVTKSPAYIVVNWFRDQLQTWALSRDFVPFWTGVKGVRDVARGDDAVVRYQMLAGLQGGIDSNLVDTMGQGRDALQLRKSGFFAAPTTFQSVLRTMEITEAATRVAHMDAAYQRLLREDGFSEEEAAFEAAYNAHDVMDFSRSGSRMMATARLVAFLNAQVQGLSVALRTISGERDSLISVRDAITPYIAATEGSPLSVGQAEQIPNSTRVYLKVAMIGLAGLALKALYDDDPEHEELSRSEMADTHWFFKLNGTWWRVPKPFELAILSNLFEAMYDRLAKQDPLAMQRFRRSIRNTVFLSPEIQVAEGIGTLYRIAIKEPMNELAGKPQYDKDKSDLPHRMKGLPAEMQFDAYTSEFGKMMGATFGLSPYRVDTVIRSLLASVGRDALTVSDSVLPRLNQVTGGALPGVGLDPRADKSFEDTIFISRISRRSSRGAYSTYNFWQEMGQDNGRYTMAAKGYHTLLTEQKSPRDAQAMLMQLDPDRRAYAVLDHHYKEKDKDIHPLNRARQVVSALSAVRRQMVMGTLYVEATDGKKYRDAEKIVVPPSTQRVVNEILEDIAMREARNAQIVLGKPGWANAKEMPVDGLWKELAAVAPQVADELKWRMSHGKTKVYSYDGVKKAWPEVRKRLLSGENGSLADLRPGYYADVE